jgi:hypothetical protein
MDIMHIIYNNKNINNINNNNNNINNNINNNNIIIRFNQNKTASTI